MSREPKGQRDNSQGRIGITAGGKYRTAGDEEIRHAMHPAIGIDNAVPGIVVHPGSAKEVVRAVELSGLQANSFLHRGESADTVGSQFLVKNLLRLADAAQVELVPAPENLDFSLAVGVGLLLQHDTIGAVRRLLDKGAEAKFTETAFQPGKSRPAAMTF
jgi:hypothetical protein